MKIALITGASQGIGAAIASELNNRKIKVILVSRSLKKSKKKFYFPTAYEGLLTAKFIDGCVKSSSKKKWVQF